ncbi:MAG: hypothetical protein LUF35_05655 [Lachnospiraceae bacterium]|nr:hypothetical protein [Lachnospiraceae bacterium]
MTAKQYLSKIRWLDIRLQQKADELKKLQDNAIGIRGIDYSADRVQGTPSGGMPAVENYVDQEKAIRKQYNQLAYCKRKIIHQIKRLDEPRYSDVLFMRYVQCWKWDKVASRLSITKRQAYRIHDDALAYFEEKYLSNS